mmetsp:Transcript_30761/g.86753  ORF Transcript_30761/g.86753 Transcript_30761/m.86753 type:complete len:309 (+) Transcript_30761:581-1507(+)
MPDQCTRGLSSWRPLPSVGRGPSAGSAPLPAKGTRMLWRSWASFAPGASSRAAGQRRSGGGVARRTWTTRWRSSISVSPTCGAPACLTITQRQCNFSGARRRRGGATRTKPSPCLAPRTRRRRQRRRSFMPPPCWATVRRSSTSGAPMPRVRTGPRARGRFASCGGNGLLPRAAQPVASGRSSGATSARHSPGGSRRQTPASRRRSATWRSRTCVASSSPSTHGAPSTCSAPQKRAVTSWQGSTSSGLLMRRLARAAAPRAPRTWTSMPRITRRPRPRSRCRRLRLLRGRAAALPPRRQHRQGRVAAP